MATRCWLLRFHRWLTISLDVYAFLYEIILSIFSFYYYSCVHGRDIMCFWWVVSTFTHFNYLVDEDEELAEGSCSEFLPFFTYIYNPWFVLGVKFLMYGLTNFRPYWAILCNYISVLKYNRWVIEVHLDFSQVPRHLSLSLSWTQATLKIQPYNMTLDTRFSV